MMSCSWEGGMLDRVATFAGYEIADLTVGRAHVISDHSLITCSLLLRRQMKPTPEHTVRSWRGVDRQAFIQVIKDSRLGSTSSSSFTAEELFAEYDAVLRDIADQFVEDYPTGS